MNIPGHKTNHFANEPCLPEVILQALKSQAKLNMQGENRSLDRILSETGGLPADELQAQLQQTIYNILSISELFDSFQQDELFKISRLAELRAEFPDKIIFQEGEPAEDLYLIVSGRVEIFKSYGNIRSMVLDTLGPGSWFGEMAFLGQGIRSASIKCLEGVSLVRLPYKALTHFFHSHQDFTLELLKDLCERLIHSNSNLAQSFSKEQVLKQTLSQQTLQVTPSLVGQSRTITKLEEKIRQLGSNTHPVMIQGEAGTELTAAAKHLHMVSRDQDSPFLIFDPRKGPGNSKSQAPERDQRPQEIKSSNDDDQRQRLFGWRQKGSSSEFPIKPGLLQIADEGTLVIENIEHLTRNTQNLLADFIKTGSFLPLNTQTPILSSVRIMATCGENPENLIQKGQLQQELVKLFHEESLFLPPLRKRKKDLRLIVKHLIEKSNDLYGKNVQRLGQEAYQRIVSYDWPGNYEELATTIERGVKLAQGETLLSEDLFFGLKPLKGKLSFDILKLEPAQRIFKSKAYPRLAQAVSGLFLLGLVSLGFFGSRIPAGKFSLALTWGIWEPLVIVSALLLARIWCAACPVGGGCLYISRHFSLKKEVPLFIRRYGLYICAAGLIAIFWSQAAWNMYDSPRATAALVATIAGLGLVSGLIFHKLVWCRYLCPLGALVGLFARSSCTEMRSNVHVCNHECRDHTCLEDAEYNCPMLEAPFTQQSNQNCILCGNCVKACPNGSPNLNLRAPGYELSVVRYPIGFMNLFVPVLLGCQLFRATAQLDIPILEDSLSRIWLLWPGLLCLFLIFAYQYIQISGKRIFGDLIKPDINKGNLLNYALVPLLLGIELSFQLELMLVKNREFLLTLNEHFALIWKSLTFSFDPKIIIFYQLLLLAISSLAAALVLNKIALRHQSFRTGLSWRKRWPIFMLAAIFAWLSIAG